MCKNLMEQTIAFVPWFDTMTYSFRCVNCGAPGPYGVVEPLNDIYYSADGHDCWVDGGPVITALTCKNFRPKVKPNV